MQIELLLNKIAKVPAAKQSVFWRATAPGHPHCELSNAAENRTDFRSTTDPSFMRYNWDLFEKLNYRWQKRLGATPGGPGKDIVTGMQYLDIWPMSVQRPDSHLLPPNDCLHYCYGLGGVIEEWQKVGLEPGRLSVRARWLIEYQTTVLMACGGFAITKFGLQLWQARLSISLVGRLEQPNTLKRGQYLELDHCTQYAHEHTTLSKYRFERPSKSPLVSILAATTMR